MKLNVRLIKEDIKKLSNEIVESNKISKEYYRERSKKWIMWGDYIKLKNINLVWSPNRTSDYTNLCALRAHMRGRIHMRNKQSALEQAEMVAHLMVNPRYVLIENVPEVSAA